MIAAGLRHSHETRQDWMALETEQHRSARTAWDGPLRIIILHFAEGSALHSSAIASV